MAGYAVTIKRLIQELARFPGIGEKTAARLAAFIIREPEEDALRLADAIAEVKRRIRLCSVCFNLTEGEQCDICRDASREKEVVCIVEDSDALIAIEESGSFRGMYHVLHGALAPLDGIGPENLRLQELLARVQQDGVKEIIVATNPTVQGEATALLITRLVKGVPIKVSRIALGIPVGSELKYTDKMTMGKALEFRRAM
jgi:recombination protein RecR